MGLSSSVYNFDRQQKFLIGNLSHLPLSEQHYFSLSSLVLLNSKHGQMKDILKRATHQPKRTSKPCISVTSSSSSLPSSSAGTDACRPCPNVFTSDGRIFGTQSLFTVIPLEKPLYATQTFVQWNVVHEYSSLFSLCKPPSNVLYLQPVGDFPDFLTDFTIKLEHYPMLDFFGFLQLFASLFFHGLEVEVRAAVDHKKSQWSITSRHHSKTGRKQLLVGDFYSPLQRLIPRGGCGIMGIIWTDLYPCEELNFILGEVSAQHKAGIFCFGRCEPKTFSAETFTDISQIDARLIWRLLKVLSHEVCHIFGFAHCEYFFCSMNGSSSLLEAFSQPMLLCPVCLRKLQQVCGFSLLKRYTLLRTFLTDLQQIFPLRELQETIAVLDSAIVYLENITDSD